MAAKKAKKPVKKAPTKSPAKKVSLFPSEVDARVPAGLGETKSLRFLAAFTSLRSLNLGDSTVTDFKTLPMLPALTSVEAENRPITSLKGLERAPKLMELNLTFSELGSLEGIEVLTGLRTLNVSEAKITDLSPLALVASLEDLDVSETAVVDLTPLERCKRLRTIECRRARSLTRGVAALYALPKLKKLEADQCKLPPQEVAAFKAARPEVDVRFGDLDLSKAATTDADRVWWESLDEHPQLRDALQEDQLDDDEPIDGQLGALAAEDHLSISDSNIRSLAPLARMSRLVFTGAPVSSLDALAGHGRLLELDCSSTHVTDLSPLAGCTELECIDCYDLKRLGGLMTLSRLPRLTTILSHGSFDEKDLAAFRLARPDVEVA